VISGFQDFPALELGPARTACTSDVLDAGLPGLSYLWSTGATTQQITASATGFYAVTVTNSFGCASTDTVSVFIVPPPRAEFAYSVSGYQVFFENLSSLGFYSWDFGDGNSSIDLGPVHTYADTGLYQVQLIVTDYLNNCGSDTITLPVRIIATTHVSGLLSQAGIRVQPVPADEVVEVVFTQSIPGTVLITLADLSGRILRIQETLPAPVGHALPVGDLPPGLYLISVTAQDGSRWVRQLVIL
jgi:hypothetical protein